MVYLFLSLYIKIFFITRSQVHLLLKNNWMVFKKIIECVTVFVVFAFKAQSKDLGNGSDSGSVVFDLAWIPHTHIKAVTAIKWQNQRSMYKITIELGNNVSCNTSNWRQTTNNHKTHMVLASLQDKVQGSK